MNRNRKTNTSRLQITTEILFPLLLLLFPLLKMNQGVDLTDTPYSLGNYRFFTQTEGVWVLSTFLSNVMGFLLTKLPMGGTMLGMKFYTSLLISVMALFSYRFFKTKMPSFIAFAGEMAAIGFCWCPTGILYNYMTYLFFLFGAVFLFRGLAGNRPKCLFLAGIFLGLNVAVRVPNILEAALIIAVWYYGIRKNKTFEMLAKETGLCVGGFLAASGGSGFFGALFAGFIGGYLVLALRKLFSTLPDSLEGLKPVLLYPVFGLVLMGVLMTYVINPPTAAFNNWLAATLASMSTVSKVLLGFILGGMMSIDFGGPINKAAYVFGTASLAAADGSAVSSAIMASVMVGGMVPPLAISLSTMLFKNKYTARERQSGITNVIMGMSFITEGAIPFAASDPLRVIPCCALGSAIAGALSQYFGCSVPAPHGGVFVFGVVQNWPMYFAALLVGSVVAAVLLGFLKKKVVEE